MSILGNRKLDLTLMMMLFFAVACATSTTELDGVKKQFNHDNIKERVINAMMSTGEFESQVGDKNVIDSWNVDENLQNVTLEEYPNYVIDENFDSALKTCHMFWACHDSLNGETKSGNFRMAGDGVNASNCKSGSGTKDGFSCTFRGIYLGEIVP